MRRCSKRAICFTVSNRHARIVRTSTLSIRRAGSGEVSAKEGVLSVRSNNSCSRSSEQGTWPGLKFPHGTIPVRPNRRRQTTRRVHRITTGWICFLWQDSPARIFRLVQSGLNAATHAREALALGRVYRDAGLDERAEHGFERALVLIEAEAARNASNDFWFATRRRERMALGARRSSGARADRATSAATIRGSRGIGGDS